MKGQHLLDYGEIAKRLDAIFAAYNRNDEMDMQDWTQFGDDIESLRDDVKACIYTARERAGQKRMELTK